MKKVFIHIPKNAGSAIKTQYSNKVLNARYCIDPVYKKELEKVFTGKQGTGTPNYTHCRWRDLDEKYKHYTAFAIVRNPWDKVVSRYTFREIIRKNRGTFKPITFKEFLEERHEKINKPFFWHRAVSGWYQQLEHVINENGDLVCDILRYEMLNLDIMKYLDVKDPVKWKNVSNGTKIKNSTDVANRINYKNYYDEESKEIVADWYKEDINFFGFTFEGTATKNIWYKK